MASPEHPPFFHQLETRAVIGDVATQPSLAVFAGAGVTIDKSGLDWAGLVDGLLETHIKDERVRRQLLTSLGPARAASVTAELFKDLHGDNYRDRMTDVLRVHLYAHGSWQEGRLARNLARLLCVWNYPALGSDTPDFRSLLVTPNYDDYILREMKSALDVMARESGLTTIVQPVVQPVFSTDVDPLAKATNRPKPKAKATVVQSLPEGGQVPCIYLHGYIPREAFSTSGSRYPVVSEEDYFLTEGWNAKCLEQVFSEYSALIVGASLRDAPLLRALLGSKKKAKNKGLKRWAVVSAESLHVGEASHLTEVKRLTRERLKHFGVEAIYPDWYGQVAQLIEEVITCKAGTPTEYESYNSGKRYGSRLLSWWGRWNELNRPTPKERQEQSHVFLYGSLKRIAEMLQAPTSEPLKLEFWIRWAPNDKRVLRLWASSVGTWSSIESMREGDLKSDSPYVSIQTFCSGRTQHWCADAPDAHESAVDGRWRSYLSTPIWYPDPNGAVPVAVITLASTRWGIESSLGAANRTKLSTALGVMRKAGEALADPDPDAMRVAGETFLIPPDPDPANPPRSIR
jgi:hypothetical protein